MDNSSSSNSNAIFGKGPWIRKKRYEEEDFTFSPPSDDSGFLPLKIGLHQTKTDHESMFDRINQELGFMEVSKPQTYSGSSGEGNCLTSRLFGSDKIILEPQDSSYSQNISVLPEGGKNSPKIFIPPTISERRESQADFSNIAGIEERPEFSRVAREDAATLVSKARSGRPTRKISMNLESTINRRALLESFQPFSVSSAERSSPHTEENSTTSPIDTVNIPFLDDIITIPTLPLIEEKLVFPPSFQERRRKISAPPNLNPMTMERSSNYFFSGGIFSSHLSQVTTLSEGPSMVADTTSPHLPSNYSQYESNSPNRPQPSLDAASQMMSEGNRESLGIEPKTKVGKRRPKPSALREMNFWAPQSM